jgi:hypothetical protein
MPDGKFTGYAKTVDQAAARAAFEQEHGYTPAGVFDGGSIWLAGPILSPEERIAQVIQGEQLTLALVEVGTDGHGLPDTL